LREPSRGACSPRKRREVSRAIESNTTGVMVSLSSSRYVSCADVRDRDGDREKTVVSGLWYCRRGFKRNEKHAYSGMCATEAFDAVRSALGESAGREIHAQRGERRQLRDFEESLLRVVTPAEAEVLQD
jgi:hypothetical protein